MHYVCKHIDQCTLTPPDSLPSKASGVENFVKPTSAPLTISAPHTFTSAPLKTTKMEGELTAAKKAEVCVAELRAMMQQQWETEHRAMRQQWETDRAAWEAVAKASEKATAQVRKAAVNATAAAKEVYESTTVAARLFAEGMAGLAAAVAAAKAEGVAEGVAGLAAATEKKTTKRAAVSPPPASRPQRKAKQSAVPR